MFEMLNSLAKKYLNKSIILCVIIFTPILFGQVHTIPLSRVLKDKKEKKEFYQISSLARSSAVEIIIPLKSGSGVLIEKKGRQYTTLTAWHIFEDTDLNIPFKIRTADYKLYKVNKGSIK